MIAAVYYGLHDIMIEDVAEPEIGSGGIIVKEKACGIYQSHYQALTSSPVF